MSRFTRSQVCAIIGNTTYRQLSYWLKTGLIKGPKNKNQFTWDDLLEIKTIRALLDAGVSLQAIRKGLRFNKSLGGQQVTLLTDGKTVFRYESDTDAIIDVLHSGQLVMGIFLPDLYHQVCRQAVLRDITPPKRWVQIAEQSLRQGK